MSQESKQTLSIDTPSGLTLFQQARDITLVAAFLGVLAWWAFWPMELFPVRVIPVGTVEGIRYFGSLLISTQVDIRLARSADAGSGPAASDIQRSLVVSGVTRFRKGQEVVLVVGSFDTFLCIPDKSICDRVYGHRE